MLKKIFAFVFLITYASISSQNQRSVQFYKDKFFIYQKIGVDSAMIYVNKIFSSKKDIDQAFAYTSKRFLLTVIEKKYDEKNYLLQINSYLKKIPETKENYTDLSHIYNILGNTDWENQMFNEAIRNFIKADFFAQKNNDVKQHIKIKANIAGIKLELKQIDDALLETKEALKLLKANKNLYEKGKYEVLHNNLFSNLGHLYSDKFISDIDKNKKYADSAFQNFHQLLNSTKEKNFQALAYRRLGTLDNYKKNYSKATEYYLKSLEIYKSLQFKDEILNLTYNIGVNYYDSKEYLKAKQNFLELSGIMEKDTIVNIDYIFAQDYLSKIYLKENHKDSVEYYSNKFMDLYKENSEIEKKEIAELYKDLNSKNLDDEINKNSSILRNHLFLIIALVLLIIIIIIYLLYQIKKKNRTEQRLNVLLTQVKNNSLNAGNRANKNNFTISNEKEAEIINKLLELEEKRFYLKKEYSLTFVAKKLNTNTNYLSQTVNKHMKKSFSEYSNELKINYILKELSENKKLRSYTTQALADMVGYKSGISFAKTFKEKTGVTPFQYIEKLNAEALS
ncbi:helix-turn-helix domain-containing protein [Chryseobacterium kwangjuense]|uniref:Helix-turn-helix domain-containing protein n=1 Tax=Chryseobacterium kwangjuense TaxID=267125 RepID=A0ABW9K089_9FLAO